MINSHLLELTGARVVRYRMPLKRPYGTARGKTRSAINFVVELEAEGPNGSARGFGECQPRHALTGDGGKDRKQAWEFARSACGLLVGRGVAAGHRSDSLDPIRAVVRDLEALAMTHADDTNRSRPFRGTLLGFEVALLDVVARVQGLRVSELLGERRQELRISISTISSANSVEQAAKRAVRQRRFPMTRVKGSGDLDGDLRLLEAVSAANASASLTRPLWIDINEAFDLERAVAFCRAVARSMAEGSLPDELVVEGMLPKDSFLQLPQVQAAADQEFVRLGAQGLDLRVMPDEGLWDASDLRALAAAGGCRAINIKAPKAGGLLPSLELAEAAVDADADVRISLGGMVGTSDVTAWALHNLARGLPRCDYLTAVPPGNVETRITEPLAAYVDDRTSLIAPQELPGLGADVVWGLVEPYVEADHGVGSLLTRPTTVSIAQVPSAPLDVARVVRTLVFGGDTSLGDVHIRRRGGLLQSRLESDPASFLGRLTGLVEGADAVVLNFESVLAVNPTGPNDGRKPYLGWDTPGRTVACLKRLGVDAVGLANNHTMDYGAEHLLSTIAAFEDAGIRTFGAGTDARRAAAPLSYQLDVDGGPRRIHILAGMQVQRRLREEFDFYAGTNRAGVHALGIMETVERLQDLRTTDPSSLLIVFPHWGANYRWVDSKQSEAAARFHEAGADVVLGHGAHMLQEVSLGPDRATAFSLGNFQFNWAGRFTEKGMPPFGLVARLEAAPVASRWNVVLRLYPILSDNRLTNHRPRPVTHEEFTQVYEVLTGRDEDGTFEGIAVPAQDDRGFHLMHAFGEDPPPLPRRTESVVREFGIPPDPEFGTPNVYDDPPTRRVLSLMDKRLCSSILLSDQARAAGADITWLASDTFVAHVGGRSLLFRGNRAVESSPSTALVQDKAIVKQLLARDGVSVPEGGAAGSLEEARAIFAQLGRPTVVKPRRGDRSVGVTVGITTDDELVRAFERAYSAAGVVVEEAVHGPEYRCIVTPDACHGVLRRDPPSVIGDGANSLRTLLKAKNAVRRRNPGLRSRPIRVDEHLEEFLARAGLTLDTVPADGEKVYVGSTAGTSGGGDSIEFTESAPESVVRTAIAAVGAIPGMGWAGVDVIHVADPDDGDGRSFVLEINSNAGISSFHFPVFGRPRALASIIWELRTQREDPSLAEPRRCAPAATEGDMPSSRGGLCDAYLEWLEAAGWDVERLSTSLAYLRRDGRSVLIHGLLGGEDYSALRHVVNRRVPLRRALERSAVPSVPQRTIRSVGDLRNALNGMEDPLVLTPSRGRWDPRAAVPLSTGDDDATLRDGLRAVGGSGGAVIAQSRPNGNRLRVFATAGGAVLVTRPATERAPRPVLVEAACDVGAAAVRAVPELRWAAVDIVVKRPARLHRRAPRALVEGMTVEPAVSPGDRVVCGALSTLFSVIAPR